MSIDSGSSSSSFESPAAKAAAVEFNRETSKAAPPGVCKPSFTSSLTTVSSVLQTRVCGGVFSPDEEDRNCGEEGDAAAATAAAAASRERTSSSSSSTSGEPTKFDFIEMPRSSVNLMRCSSPETVVDKVSLARDKCVCSE